jgi:hypothetical protein
MIKFFLKKNIVFEDRERKILFVKKLDGYAMKLMMEGWTVEEVGELRLMTADSDIPRPFGTLDRCSPPMGRNGRYVTAAHCLELTPLFIECSENCSDGPKITKAEVVEKVELVPTTWRCIFQDCTNYYDYGVISRGIEYEIPDLVLSFGNAKGNVAGFTPAPYYRGHPIGRRVKYVVYDYHSSRFVTIETKIVGYGNAYVSGPDRKLYKIRAYIAKDDKVIAQPGFSGAGVFVLKGDNA